MISLRRQLTRDLLLVLASLLGAGLLGVEFAVRQALVHSFDNALHTRAQAVSALTEVDNGRFTFDFTDDFLRGYDRNRPINYFEIRDAAGRTLVRSPSLRGADLPAPPGGTPPHPEFWSFTLPDGRAARGATFAFLPAGTPAGTPPIQVAVASRREGLDETLGGLLAAVAGAGVLLFLAVLLIVPRVLRRSLDPLAKLGEQAAAIDAGSLATRFPAERLPEELQPIAARLNDLLARLETSFERERRFSADLAHELRTPLAELRNLAECALKWPHGRDPATDRDVLAIAVQMETLVSRMLALVRGDRNVLDAHPAPTDIALLVARAWTPFAADAAARGLRVTLTLAPGEAAADAALLVSVLNNLFDNAVDHAPAGGELRIAGAPAVAGGYTLRCANPAPALTAADVEKLFDRFWRKDAARTGEGRHIGIGLNLARQLAEAMDWRLTAELDADGWLVFTLATG